MQRGGGEGGGGVRGSKWGPLVDGEVMGAAVEGVGGRRLGGSFVLVGFNMGYWLTLVLGF